MSQKIYQVDAFTSEVFSGNPAAVCPLKEWLSDEVMQKIANENNLAETAFYVKNGEQYEIRWLTPAVEVDLCGHATLAAAFILFNHEGYDEEIIYFHSPRSGLLTVKKEETFLTLNFPTDIIKRVEITNEIIAGFNIKPRIAYKGKTDYLLIYDSENEVRTIQYNLEAISKLGGRGIIISAEGNEVDFVSRFFAPQSGISEDPVTGSAHTTLTPYWSEELGKQELTAMQISHRKGYLKCRNLGERTEISGECKLYMIGEIYF
jgi:PhzF family phenazine biosynthesis protein